MIEPLPASSDPPEAACFSPAREADRRLRALTDIARLVTLGLEVSPILRHAAVPLPRPIDAPYVGIWLLGPDNGDLVLAATAGPLRDAFELNLRRPASTRTLNRVILESGRPF